MDSRSCGQSCDPSQSQSSVCHQLSQSVVKPFKSGLNLQSIKKYICDQCLDEFIHESSLTTHLERRSVLITYFCDKCNERLIFFNRCTLLSHIRSHIEKSDQNEQRVRQQLSQVLVKPIDLSQLFADLNKNNNIIEDVKSVVDGIDQQKTSGKTNVVKTSVKTTAIKRDANESNVRTNPTNTLFTKKFVIKKSSNSELKCSECNHSFNCLWTREQHLVDKQLVLPLNQCKVCPTICPTNCNQSIHNSLHTRDDNSTGMSCPECGHRLDESNPSELMTHIIINCLHLSRRLVYICTICSQRMSSLNDFVQHIKSIHTTQHFQCSHCLLKFKVQSELRQHQTDSQCSDSESIVCHLCPICETVFKSLDTYSDHFTGHRKKFFNYANFIYVCLKCNDSFLTKTDLKSHLNGIHFDTKTDSERKVLINELFHEVLVRFKLCVRFDLHKNSDKSENNNKNIEKRNSLNLNGTNDELNDNSVKRAKILTNNNDLKDNTNDIKSAQKVSNDNWFECRECGLNYPFVQTLKRHLILEHRIHDVESYISNTYIEIPVIVTTEPQLPKEVGEERLSQILDSEDSTDTTCPICSLKFPDSKALKVHGRVHGMAFIKSCQKKSI